MASVPPPAPVQQQPPLQNDPSTPLAPLSWEGDKMFNIYIYDYCYKRGFRKTARELQHEAEIPPESAPPINARQGLLFEWWSVFWVLFQAKSNGGGTEDALLYTQHQQQQQQRNARPGPQGPLPPAPIPGQPPAQLQRPPPQMAGGMMNGMTGSLPGQAQLPPNAGQMNFAIGGAPGPQTNGVPGPHPPTPGSAPTQPHQHPQGPQQPTQQPNFAMMQSGQRPANMMNGPPPPQQPPPANQNQQQLQRNAGPNPNLPFRSPTLAHSPNVGAMQQAPQPPHGQQPAPMGNLAGPSPTMATMNRGMLPPNGTPQSMVMGGVPQQGGPVPPGGAPSPAFPQMSNTGRPPSRTNTPQMQQGGMIHQSPSMANRQIPMLPDSGILSEFQRIEAAHLQPLKRELGLADKNDAVLTIQEKRRIVEYYFRRTKMVPGPAPGSSNIQMQPTQQRVPPPVNAQQQPQQQRGGGKRNSTSPGEEHDSLPGGDSSPPNKRMRRSPMEGVPKNQTPMGYPPTPQQAPAGPPPQSGQPQGPPMQGLPPSGLQSQPAPTGMPPNMMMGQRPMGPQGAPMGMPQVGMGVNGHISQGMAPPSGPSMGVPMPQGGMNPQNPAMPHPAGMGMQNQMNPNYRLPLNQVHTAGLMSGNTGSPAGGPESFGGPQFHPGAPNNRLAPKPPQTGMPGPPGMIPPPSPANAGAKDGKDGKQNMDGSPKQPPQQGGPSQQPGMQQPPPQGQGGLPSQIPPPGTPAPQSQQPPLQSNPGPPPPPSGASNTGMTASPNPMLGTGNGGMGGLGQSLSGLGDQMLFNSEFDNMVNEFGQDMFTSTGGGLDFERDFGQWFNPDDINSMDMK